MKRLNKRGFTLVELLAVIVILIAITAIAIPTISSALDRTKEKQNDQRKRILESAAELFVSEHKNSIEAAASCISLDALKKGGYVDEEALKDANGDDFVGYILIDKENGKYTFTEGNHEGCYGDESNENQGG